MKQYSEKELAEMTSLVAKSVMDKIKEMIPEDTSLVDGYTISSGAACAVIIQLASSMSMATAAMGDQNDSVKISDVIKQLVKIQTESMNVAASKVADSLSNNTGVTKKNDPTWN
jgi:short subunit fatty acids transporter